MKQKNWLPKSFLSRDATVPQPGIRVGFIPGGSTDSVSILVTLVTMANLVLVTLMVLTLLVVILLVVFDDLEHLGINIDIQIIRETIWLGNELMMIPLPMTRLQCASMEVRIH